MQMVSIKNRAVLAAMFFVAVGMQVVNAAQQPVDHTAVENDMAWLASKYPETITFKLNQKNGPVLAPWKFKALSRSSLLACYALGAVAAVSICSAISNCTSSSWLYQDKCIETSACATVCNVLFACFVYKRFYPDLALGMTNQKLIVPGKGTFSWSDIKKLSVGSEFVVEGSSSVHHGYGFYSTHNNIADKKFIKVHLKNGDSIKINADSLPIFYRPLYNIMLKLLSPVKVSAS